MTNSSKRPGSNCIPGWFWETESLNFHTKQLIFSICISRDFIFHIVGKSDLWYLYFRMLGSGLLLKASTSLFSKIFEKLVNNVFVDNLEKYGLYLISSMVLCPLIQLQIFWELHSIVLLGLLIGWAYTSCGI